MFNSRSPFQRGTSTMVLLSCAIVISFTFRQTSANPISFPGPVHDFIRLTRHLIIYSQFQLKTLIFCKVVSYHVQILVNTRTDFTQTRLEMYVQVSTMSTRMLFHSRNRDCCPSHNSAFYGILYDFCKKQSISVKDEEPNPKNPPYSTSLILLHLKEFSVSDFIHLIMFIF